MANLLSLAPELLLNICEYLVLIEAEELRENVELRERVMHHRDDIPAGPCHTAYRTLSVMARTCRILRPIAMDSFNKHAVWLFNRPIATFTQQTVPDKTRHIEILRDDIASYPPRYRGRTRDEIAQDVSQVSERWHEDIQETITKDPAQVELALFISKASEITTLAMKTGHVHADISDKRGYGESPVWLLPIIDAMEESKTD
jgi:paraquat-inducible protein B